MTATARRDFSRQTLRILSRRGVEIISSTLVPDESGGCANASVAYIVAIRGTGCVRTYREVLALAA